MKKYILGMILTISFSTQAQELNVIGWQNGNEIVEKLSTKKYQKLLKQTENALGELIESEFNDLDNKSFSYKLSTICFGIGASGEVGLGPWKIGTGFRQRFYYKR